MRAITKWAASALAIAIAGAATAEMKFYAAFMRTGPNWIAGKAPPEQPGFEAHYANLTRMLETGALVSAGPFADMTGGMAVLRAASIEEAEAHMAADGFVSAGAMTVEVVEWRPALGVVDLAASLALSQPAPDKMRTLRHEAIVRAPVAEVWAAFTTAEGFRKLGVARAEVDLRVGGAIRSSYLPDSDLNDDSTIVNTILACAPQRMLALRNTKAPAGFPHGPALQRTWSVTTFEPLGPDATRIEMTGYGWGDDEASNAAYDFFEQGNRASLDALKQALEGEAVSALTPAQTLERLAMLAGGEWIAEQPTPDGGTFRVRGVTRRGPDGRSLVTRGWLGSDEGMFEHGAALIWLDPALDEVRFQSIDEGGGVARGAIVGLSEDHLRWDWNLERPNGATTRFRVDMKITGPDSYTFELYAPTPEGGWTLAATTDNRRVEQAPPAFRKMRAEEHTMGDERIEEWTDGAVRVLARRGVADERWSEFEVVLPESRDAAWARLTTPEGLQTFFAPKAVVDLREGGAWELLFFPDAPVGQRGAEGVTIRTIDAPRSLEVHWNAPPQFPEVRTLGFRARFALEPIDHATTRVTLRLDEFREGEQWDGTFDYFLKAYPVVLNRMRRAVIDGPLDWEAERARASNR